MRKEGKFDLKILILSIFVMIITSILVIAVGQLGLHGENITADEIREQAQDNNQEKQKETDAGKQPIRDTASCNDETPYSECSSRKPLYCKDGALILKASVCSCPEGFTAEGDGCFSQAEKEEEERQKQIDVKCTELDVDECADLDVCFVDKRLIKQSPKCAFRTCSSLSIDTCIEYKYIKCKVVETAGIKTSTMEKKCVEDCSSLSADKCTQYINCQVETKPKQTPKCAPISNLAPSLA